MKLMTYLLRLVRSLKKKLMREKPMSEQEIIAEIRDILVIILLCDMEHPNDIIQLKKCLKKIRKRTREKTIRKMLSVWIRLKDPSIAIERMIHLVNT
ncbi:hypothetical protein HOU79_gp85 [Vibrio phage 1.224.A._10N.261.48.B1]|uniref:Uncharacterized protein n=1 Tax=Vibrio phage 1.224.A._10N.261.48.B1 TaxID=1881226 RepID=A0A2I7RRX3_9CAUD|nr:hypothetical protein HOU79_gp85 [Vibrio phage 1.224.A._10N.261.48.B1]AUR96388.1 hypothetical protein NVP1224A_21 [Vibrio phage 1.224.A._10N.261.48.B1]